MKPAGLVIRRTDCDVRTIPLADAQELVTAFHYAKGTANTAVFRHGLFWKGLLVGCTWWMPPTKNAAAACFPGDWRAVLTLSRLVVIPTIPKNAATLLLMRSVKLIRLDPRWQFLVTYADEWRGHTGTIYRAAGWNYLGKTAPQPVYVDAQGVLRGRKRGPRSLLHAEMLAQNFTMVGRFAKHRYGLALYSSP